MTVREPLLIPFLADARTAGHHLQQVHRARLSARTHARPPERYRTERARHRLGQRCWYAFQRAIPRLNNTMTLLRLHGCLFRERKHSRDVATSLGADSDVGQLQTELRQRRSSDDGQDDVCCGDGQRLVPGDFRLHVALFSNTNTRKSL